MTLLENIGCIAALLAGLYFVHWSLEKRAVAAGKAEVVAEYQKQVATAQAAVKEATDTLAANKVAADKDKADELKKADDKYAALVKSNSVRRTRAQAGQAGPGAVAPVGSSCTGAQLYRDDADFLAGFAQQAESVRIERDYYYGQYESARKLLAGQEQDDGHDGSVSDPKPVP